MLFRMISVEQRVRLHASSSVFSLGVTVRTQVDWIDTSSSAENL